MNETKKLDYIDYFRGIAILFIVAGHTLCWGRNTIHSINKLLRCGGSYLFIFIAGFLFQHLSYKFDIKTYYKKKFINVICPYFSVLLVPAYLCAFNNPTPDILKETSHLSQFFGFLIAGYSINYPLWFIGMMTIFFIVSPLILHLKKKYNTLYWIIFIFSVILTLLTFKYIYALNITPLSAFIISGLKLHIKNFIHFLFFYLLGMEICDALTKYRNKIENYLPKIFKISLSLYVIHLITQLFIMKTTIHLYVISRTISIFLILSGLLIAEDKIRNNKFLDKSLKLLAQYSFGIFFVHSYFRNILDFHTIYTRWYIFPYLNIHKNTLKCCLISFGTFTVVLFGSIISLFIIKTILKKLGIKNTRMFIGV